MSAFDIAPRTHARSVSLPSNPPLIVSQFDVCIEKLNAPNTVCSSCALSDKLHGLMHMNECIDQLLELQSTQQMILNECDREWVGQVMDSSLRLLDVCGIAKDVLLQTKDCIHDFQSVLRRKSGHKAEFASEVSKYMTSRRNTKKLIQKSLKSLTNHEESARSHENITVAKMLTIADQATLKIFASLLSFLAGSSGPKDSKWCFISKLRMLPKTVVAMEDAIDFATLDAALHSHTTFDFTNTETRKLQYKLADLELTIQDFEETLNRVFRHQIRTRVSLLNILSH